MADWQGTSPRTELQEIFQAARAYIPGGCIPPMFFEGDDNALNTTPNIVRNCYAILIIKKNIQCQVPVGRGGSNRSKCTGTIMLIKYCDLKFC